jgi:hypothetical protein
MRQKRKPFVLYKGGVLRYMVVPRGIRGWTQFVLWLAMLAPLVLWFVDHVTDPRKGHEFGASVVLFATGIVAWLIGGLWWMLARAELVYVVEIRRQKQYARWEKERERRRRQQEGQKD